MSLREEAAAVLAAEWGEQARALEQRARVSLAEAVRFDARHRSIAAPYGAPAGIESLRLRQRASAASTRAWVLEMGAMLVLGPRLELLLTMAEGVALVCLHDAVEGEECRCHLARSLARSCLAEARRRGAIEREDERAARAEVGDGVV